VTQITWSEGKHRAKDFQIERDGHRLVTGALWVPAGAAPDTPMVLCGHGASGDRYQGPIPHLARRFGEESGYPVLSIDGPVHGLRQIGPGGRAAFAEDMKRPSFLDDMVGDWQLAFETITHDSDLGKGPLGYYGLSMGTIFGLPLLASTIDFTAAAIGLCGSSGAASLIGERLLDDAAIVEHPVLFIMQLEDELFDRDGYLALFDALASSDKRLHANPGLHPEVPAEEIDFVVRFLTNHLSGQAEKRVVKPLAE
jgi:pimeloyl-ACP methyl ester carboxylesterase